MARQLKILVVEDDAALRALIVACLNTGGYAVCTATNGSEALSVLQDEAPCLMVVDLDMPVMNGAELRRQQLRMPSVSDVPFVLVSAAHDAGRVASDLGIADVIPKPFDADRLLRVVGSHCQRGR